MKNSTLLHQHRNAIHTFLLHNDDKLPKRQFYELFNNSQKLTRFLLFFFSCLAVSNTNSTQAESLFTPMCFSCWNFSIRLEILVVVRLIQVHPRICILSSFRTPAKVIFLPRLTQAECKCRLFKLCIGVKVDISLQISTSSWIFKTFNQKYVVVYFIFHIYFKTSRYRCLLNPLRWVSHKPNVKFSNIKTHVPSNSLFQVFCRST